MKFTRTPVREDRLEVQMDERDVAQAVLDAASRASGVDLNGRAVMVTFGGPDGKVVRVVSGLVQAVLPSEAIGDAETRQVVELRRALLAARGHLHEVVTHSTFRTTATNGNYNDVELAIQHLDVVISKWRSGK
jgi:hypothetical protein